jgi:hypothetical protein
MIIINVLLAVIFLFSAFTVIYSLVFSVAGLFARKIKMRTQQVYKKTVVFITAYKNDEVLLTVNHSLHQAYPAEQFDLIVIADELSNDIIAELNQLPVTIMQVPFKGSHTVAIREGIRNLSKQYDNAVILESGDRMQIDFLLNVNNALASGCYAIQGNRIPVRLNNSFAILEGLCHDIHNHIFRKGQQSLGFSSAMSSSAIGISFLYLKQIIEEIDPDECLEKELELKLIDDNHRIFYIDSAVVKNDKAQDSVQFISRSSQYIILQMTQLRKHLRRGILSMLFGKTDFANRIVYYAMIPNLVMMAFLVFAATVSMLSDDRFIIHTSHWILLTGTYAFAILVATPFRYFNFKTLLALATLPFNFIKMMKAVMKVKRTERKTIEIPVMNNE